jgi:hypothetical protein
LDNHHHPTMKKKSYLSKNEDLFFDYLPEEVFNSLTPEERVHYREYRRYHHLLFQSKKKVESMEKQLLKLKSKIKEERTKWKNHDVVREGDVYEVEGWNSTLKHHYAFISELDKKFKLQSKIEYRDRTSRSLKIQMGKSKRKFLERVSNTYDGKPLIERRSFVGRIISVGEKHNVSFYLGTEESVRNTLTPIFGDSVLTESINRLKIRITPLMVQYTRYTVFHHGWAELKSKKKNLQLLLDWVQFCESTGIKREEWG